MVCALNFPDNREINREIREIWPISADLRLHSPRHFNGLWSNSLSHGTGKVLWLTGKFVSGTGTQLPPEHGSSPQHVFHPATPHNEPVYSRTEAAVCATLAMSGRLADDLRRHSRSTSARPRSHTFDATRLATSSRCARPKSQVEWRSRSIRSVALARFTLRL
jgi:hypothetical protein